MAKTQTAQLIKLALKRDSSIPAGQPAPMHLNCQCGSSLPVEDADIECGTCGNRYNSAGWLLHGKAVR